ncbi:histidine kinase [Williamsia limnetica]|uniref:Histidine kinase n=1 Tax=Williamsia limnetica TaxID=882452 RepID=A0A318RBI7_WILLI|nr:GAF domain-containing protein [Williamsia limnetica]PYE12457.1 histidine kinase [Williamsia limnetica]
MATVGENMPADDEFAARGMVERLVPLPEFRRATAVLAEVGLNASTYDHVVQGISDALLPIVGAQSVGIAIWSDAKRYLQLVPGSFGASADMVASSQVDATDRRSGAARVISTGQAYYTNDAVGEIPGFEGWMRGFGIDQLLTAPLVTGGVSNGVLHVANRHSGFIPANLAQVETLAPFVAAAVEHVRRRTALRKSEALSKIVAETASSIAGGRTLEHVAAGPLRRYQEAAGCVALAISFASDQSPRIFSCKSDVPDQAIEDFVREAPQNRPRIWLQLLRPVGVGDAGASAVHVPVVVGGKRQATLSLLRIPGVPFSRAEQWSIQRLTNVIALAWATESYELGKAHVARVQERQRIADDLHDHVAQILFSAKLTLQSLSEDLDATDAAAAPVNRARELLVRSELALRDSIDHLTVTESEFLVDRLRSVVAQVEEEFQIPIRLEINDADFPTLENIAPQVADAALRAAREGMVNAAKHAGPCRVTVVLKPAGDHRFLVAVIDDGLGTSANRSDGHGLSAIRRLIRQFGGSVRLSRNEPPLMRFEVILPLSE